MTDLYVPQRILSNDRNLARTATLTPNSVQSIASARRDIKMPRSGTAGLEVTGDYSGVEEAEFEIKVTSATGTNPQASQPVFSGEGSGTLENIVPEVGADPQTITVKLVSEGLPLLYAALEVEGVTLRIREGGVAGNDFELTVDDTGLVFTPTTFSLLRDLTAGAGGQQSPMVGPEYDWGAVVLGKDNKVPTNAKRLSFGDDPTVYVQYKKYEEGEYRYFLVPALQRNVRAGEAIYEVTGTRSVEVTDGMTVETFTNIVTLYDLLNAIDTTSVLVRVDGLVVNDRSPTGMATRDLQTRTDAHALQSYGEGSEFATSLTDVIVDSGAPTELVKIKCFAAKGTDYPFAALGSEYWKVEGSVSGALEDFAVTGEPYLHPDGDWGFTIPVKLPVGYTDVPKGNFTMEEPVDYVPREQGETEPPICFTGRLGPNAQDGRVKFVWTKRPTGDCDCSDMPVSPLGGPCLDGEITQGGTPMALTATAKGKLKTLWDWVGTLSSAVSKYVDGKAKDGIAEDVYPVGDASPNSSLGASISVGVGGTLDVSDTLGGYTGGINLPIDLAVVDTTFPDDAPQTIATVAGIYENALLVIDELQTGADWDAGMTKWSEALTAWIDDLSTGGVPDMNRIAGMTAEKYRNLCRKAVAYSGQLALGKSNASLDESGDRCWQDWGDPYYFVVTGANGVYAPAFVNHPYWASRKGEDGLYYSTKEWAVQFNVKCVQDLREGDTIWLNIGAAAYPQTYQPGDVLYLPVISAGPLEFKGGQDESNTQTWNVESDLGGPMPQYSYDPDSPSSYDSGIVDFTLVPGGVDFKKGDLFQFDIEAGEFQYRKNGGSWSASLDISSTPTSIGDGLSVAFVPGAAPSYVQDDIWKFKAMQPYAASNLQTPSSMRWRWSGASGSMLLDFGSDQTVDCAAIADHTIPVGSTVTVQGGTTYGIYTWSYTMVVRSGAFFKMFTQTETARYVRLTVTATDESVGWFFVGEAFRPTTAAKLVKSPGWKVQRPDTGIVRTGRFLGKTVSAEVSWDPGTLSEESRDELLDIFDWVKSNNDEPFLLIPQFERPECIFGHLGEDQIEVPDELDYHPDADHEQLLSAKFTVQGQWQAA